MKIRVIYDVILNDMGNIYKYYIFKSIWIIVIFIRNIYRKESVIEK